MTKSIPNARAARTREIEPLACEGVDRNKQLAAKLPQIRFSPLDVCGERVTLAADCWKGIEPEPNKLTPVSAAFGLKRHWLTSRFDRDLDAGA